MFYDPVLDSPNKSKVIKEFLKEEFKSKDIQIVKGKENIKYDLIIHGIYNTKSNLKAEVKTRYPTKTGFVYQDISAELVQNIQERDWLNRVVKEQIDFKDILKHLEEKSTGWFFKSQADIIIQINKGHIYLINKKGLKTYVYKNIYTLYYKGKDCNLTSGSYNIFVPYNSETKSFIKRIDVGLEIYD